MAALKTETITVRITPAVKQSLQAMADQERRSLANMIEVMISDYCKRHDAMTSAHHDAMASGSGEQLPEMK